MTENNQRPGASSDQRPSHLREVPSHPEPTQQVTRAAAFLELRAAAQQFVARQTDTTFEQLAAAVVTARLLKLY